jgi:hypothetical protein
VLDDWHKANIVCSAHTMDVERALGLSSRSLRPSTSTVTEERELGPLLVAQCSDILVVGSRRLENKQGQKDVLARTVVTVL